MMQQMNCVFGEQKVQLESRRLWECHNLAAKAVCLAEKCRY
jgi:hypothetical protein